MASVPLLFFSVSHRVSREHRKLISSGIDKKARTCIAPCKNRFTGETGLKEVHLFKFPQRIQRVKSAFVHLGGSEVQIPKLC